MLHEVRAPEACKKCEGYGWVLVPLNSEVSLSRACDVCRCVICGAQTDVIGGECGACTDEADRYLQRVTDRG